MYLPTVFSGYYLLGRRAPTWAAAWLFVASVAFYGYWMPEFTLLLLASILWNYCPCLMSLIVSAHGQSIRPTPFVPIWQKPEKTGGWPLCSPLERRGSQYFIHTHR